MRGCFQVLAGLVAAIFVMTAIFALFTVNLAQIVTDREAIKQMTDTETLTDVAPVLLARLAREQARARNLPIDDADPAVLQAVIGELVPPGWFEARSDAAIDAVFGLLESENPAVAELEIDVRPILTRLRGEPGRQALSAGLEVLPTCTEAQTGFDLEAGYFVADSCLPPDAPVIEVATRLHRVVVETIDQSPELQGEAGVVQVPLIDEDTLTPAAAGRLQQLQQLFLLIQGRAWLLWLVPLSCLGFILLLGVRSLSELGYWWGWPLLIAAVIALFLAILMPAFLTATMLRSMAAIPDGLRVPVSQFVQQTIDALSDLWLARVYMQGGIMLVGGLLLVVVGYMKGATGRSESLAEEALSQGEPVDPHL